MKVSICCITYNHEKFICEALDGFIAQELNADLEIIISDDASTDNTTTILKAYKERYPHLIKLILNEKNIGMTPNFIQALRACSGKYIAFCEGDDYWTDSQKLKKQIELLERKKDCNILWTNFRKRHNGVLQVEKFNVNYVEGLFKIDLENLFKQYVTWTLTCLLRRDVVDLEILEKMKYARDNTIYVMALNRGYGLLLEDDTAVYRIHEGGVYSMRNKFVQNIEGYKNILEIEKFFPELKKGNFFSEVKKGLFINSFIYFFKERYFKRLKNVRVKIFLKELLTFNGLFYVLQYGGGVLKKKVSIK